MRVIHLPGPLHNRKTGLFNTVVEEKGSLKFGERFSSLPKDKFIFEETRDFENSQG